jgi:hypothetical protein
MIDSLSYGEEINWLVSSSIHLSISLLVSM